MIIKLWKKEMWQKSKENIAKYIDTRRKKEFVLQ